MGGDRRVDAFTVVGAVAAVLLSGVLTIAFLRLDLGDGAYDAALALRYLDGARLYQDLIMLHLPWSIYLNAGLMRVFPASVLTVSLAVLASGVAMTCGLGWIVFEETDRSRSPAALCVFFATYLGLYHWPMHSYGWNAVLLVTLALATLVRSDARSAGASRPALLAPAIAGLLLGTAVGFKQSIGGLMLVAVLTWFVYRELGAGQRSIGSTARGGLAFAAGALIPLVALIAVVGSDQLAAVLWQRSKIYLEWQTVSFFSNFRAPPALASIPKWTLEQATLVVLFSGVAVCALLLGLQGIRLLGSYRPRPAVLARLANDRRAGSWAIVFLGSFATIFPRADFAHVAVAVPLCFASLTILGTRALGPSPTPRARAVLDRSTIGALAALSVLMAFEIGSFVGATARNDIVTVTDFPGRRTMVARETADFLRDVRQGVTDVVKPGERLLIAHRAACFLYPYLGVSNPIRFAGLWDGIPTDAEFDDIMRSVEMGRIHAVLLDDSLSVRFAPLRTYAEQRMQQRVQIQRFTLFHLR